MKTHLYLLPVAAVLLSACGTTKDEGDATVAQKPAFKGTRVWNVGGMSIGNRSTAEEPAPEEPIGPGTLEAELAASPAEPLPEGTAPTLDANIMPDGNPAEPAEPVGQSPFDPALQPPADGASPAPPDAAPPAVPDAGTAVPSPAPPPETPAN
ncbi:MAG: hypothetical protein ACKO2G_09095 [Verrucomicrobiales bacterium]